MKKRRVVRVLHLVGIMNCGGTENMLMNIFRHIDRTRIGFDFLVHLKRPETGYFDADIRALGGTVHYISSQGSIGLFRYACRLRKFLIEHGPYDIVHCHMDWLGGVSALAVWLAGVKTIVVHSHNKTLTNKTLPVRMLLPLAKWLIRICGTDFWGCSAEACRFLFGDHLRWRVIPNAIILNRYLSVGPIIRRSWREKWGCHKETIVLGHAGSFSSVKNQRFLIEVVTILYRQGTDVRLVLVGDYDNNYGRAVKGMVRDRGLEDCVVFLGLRSDLPELLSAFDLFLFPSEFEGLGIVAVEAQAAGLGCLFSPGIPSEVDMGLNLSRRIKTMSPEMWVEAILAMPLGSALSKEVIAKKIRERGFDIVQSIKSIEHFYLGKSLW